MSSALRVTQPRPPSTVSERLAEVDWDFPHSSDKGIHAIHPYPAKFISQIPAMLLECLAAERDGAVLDPFCGAGTTLVAAQDAGIPSIGVDLNPIACLISRVKTTPLPTAFTRTALRIAAAAKPAEVPPIPNLGHWFSEEARTTLASLVAEINSVADELLRDHLRLALSSIVVRVSNQESDTRYAAISKKVSVRWVRDQFLVACNRLETAKRGRPVRVPARVMEADILGLQPETIGSVSLVITSPPYPNAYEYWLYHKYRMWWLGYDPLAVKDREIGARPHYFKKTPATYDHFRSQMMTVLQLVKAALTPGGHVCFVVGRSRIHGVDYDNSRMISAEAEALGFEPVTTIQRTIRAKRKAFNLSHARIKNEQIVVFRKQT